MKAKIPLCAALALVLPLCAAPALAQQGGPGSTTDHATGQTLTPGQAVGIWTIESHGRSLCSLRLSGARSGSLGFRVRDAASCNGVLPFAVAAWRPAPGGAALLGANGAHVGFSRWSDSLLVSREPSGLDIQLRRGPAHLRPRGD
ncbi:MAG: AprI/Inh family metalloprotease inhibitor [Caulobacteraceae bacterium]